MALRQARPNFINGVGKCGRFFHITISPYYGCPVINCTGAINAKNVSHISHAHPGSDTSHRLPECSECFIAASEDIRNEIQRSLQRTSEHRSARRLLRTRTQDGR